MNRRLAKTHRTNKIQPAAELPSYQGPLDGRPKSRQPWLGLLRRDGGRAGAERYLALAPYAATDGKFERREMTVFVVAIAFCLLYGFAFALIAPALLLLFAVPLALLAALIIWALPARRDPPLRPMAAFYWTFFIGSVLWPNYLALQLPGMPWITVARLSGAPMVLMFLTSLSVSSAFRQELSSILRAAPAQTTLVLTFTFVQFYSIALSTDVGLSTDRFITAQISWTAVYLVSAYVLARPGRIERWVGLIWAMSWIIGLIGLWENRLKHVPWAGHIPRLLQIQDPTVIELLQGTTRAYSNIYRVQSVFSGSIQLAEFIAYLLPFVIHYAVIAETLRTKILAIVTIPFLFYIAYLTNSRSGMVGFFVSAMLYPLLWAALKWRRDRSSLVAPLVVLGYPAIAALALLAVTFVGHLRALLFGSGLQKDSTLARVDQYHKGWPMVFSHPLGHGIARAGETLQWYTPGGRMTIDTYYLGVALEEGLPGLVVFYGTFLFAIFLACRELLTGANNDKQTSFLMPIAIALINFVVIKGVFYQIDNHYLVYMLLGMLVAILSCKRQSEQQVPTLIDSGSPKMAMTRQPVSHRGGPR